MAAEPPDVSVVVATHDRAARLGELLASLRAQTLAPGRFEVIVADDGSTDATGALLEREEAWGGLALRSIRRPRAGGPAAARNDGWRAARASLVAFTDDDCVAEPGWLAALVDAARVHPGAVVQGRTDPNPDELDRLGPFSRTLAVRRLGPWYQTCNILYPRELLERLGGFDATAYSGPGGEDTDLAWRAIELGRETVFAADARVFHAVGRVGPLGKLRVAWRWTESMRVFARHPELRRAELKRRVFWKASHYLLLRALVAALLPRQLRFLRWWLALPYLRHLAERGRQEGGGSLAAPFFAVHDLVELAAVARGAVRYRVLVL
jgi:glycosyltransferase involved in cell wall biosynthesis